MKILNLNRTRVRTLKVREALNTASSLVPKNDARILLMHVLSVDSAKLIASYGNELTKEACDAFFSYVSRRASGEPAAYITGRREFYGLDFIVTPDVLIPRAETEVLVDRTLLEIPDNTPVKVLDLCTGSGCIGLTIAYERKNAEVTLCDISNAALDVAKRNAKSLGVKASFILGDVNEICVPDDSYDVIVSNPPYIKTDVIKNLDTEVKAYEPHIALCGGEDGLMFYRTIAKRFCSSLAPGGALLLESGDETDGKDICGRIAKILGEYGYVDIEIMPDLSGHMRVVSARRRKKALVDENKRNGV